MTRPTFLASRPIATTCLFSASNTSLVSAFSFSGRFRGRVVVPPLFSRRTRSLIVRLLRTIPPSAAERLKQAGGVGKAVAFRLDECQLRLLIGLLCNQHCDHADRSQVSLMLSEIERPLRGALSLGARLERVGVCLQSTQ